VLTNRPLLLEALQRWRERIVVGLDARAGFVATAGWYDTSQVKATELAAELCMLGVSRIIYTDIARDGLLAGPNLVALAEMQRAANCPLIASGGVSSLDDLRALAQLDVEGVVVGKALYTGAIDLAEAVRKIEQGEK
jgi:phosphoribosylformimino-5-aminoimidazole carboxamide ribotide isomerase